mmetsp:Transcript_11103/g.32968  ORF Transcript_11103/g.32968 Transcript_11103/m.32968 type:complete len:227 (-) Transcript_11103:631-1311(-)
MAPGIPSLTSSSVRMPGSWRARAARGTKRGALSAAMEGATEAIWARPTPAARRDASEHAAPEAIPSSAYLPSRALIVVSATVSGASAPCLAGAAAPWRAEGGRRTEAQRTTCARVCAKARRAAALRSSRARRRAAARRGQKGRTSTGSARHADTMKRAVPTRVGRPTPDRRSSTRRGARTGMASAVSCAMHSSSASPAGPRALAAARMESSASEVCAPPRRSAWSW